MFVVVDEVIGGFEEKWARFLWDRVKVMGGCGEKWARFLWDRVKARGGFEEKSTGLWRF